MADPNDRRKADLSPQEQLFATEVARARAAARVSQDWVGKQIGLSRSKISEVCCGRYLPTREAVVLLIEALGMDRERTLRLWQDARDASEQRRRRERRDQRAPELAGWDRLPVLSTEVMSLLRAQVQVAEEMPYRLPGARQPSLSTVYVRQELGSEPEDSQPVRQTPVARPPAGDSLDDHQFDRPDAVPETTDRAVTRRLAIRAPSRPVREALDANDHILVTGGPGQGKSTLTLRLAADIARAWVGRDETAETVTEGDPPLAEVVVPVRIPARVLAARTDLPLPEALAAALSAEYGSMLATSTGSAVFAERIAGCRWLLLVDAVDEIADPQVRSRFVRTLSGWAAESTGRPYRLLVTSRPLESGGLAPLHRDAARYELQPFDPATLQRFATHWFDGDKDAGRRFLDQIRQAHLDELVRVPLLATIAAIIFEQPGERPLPDNRYDLFEEYLTYLASARRWPDEIGAFARLVRELLPRLLEHLGSTRFHTDVSLAAAAKTWILANTIPQQRPAAWQTDLTALLRTVGPLVVRGDDLQFLHHSFADHLAATASARLLPMPFDAEHPDWARAIHTAQHGLATQHARTVLLHYTHLRPDQADDLISWLHNNSSGFQLIAAELLSQHAPVTSAVLDAFLDTARAWARTSSGTEIFRQATHATHHPRLAAWLRDLMHDPDTKWDCRIEAAVGLCNRLRSDVDEATGVLRAAMDDVTLDLDDRLAAAEGLAKVGPDQHEAAVHGLRAVLSDPGRTAYTLRGAAVALADLGPDWHADAVRVLRATLANPGLSWLHHLQAAIGLAEIGAEFHSEAVATLQGIVADTSLGWYQRSQAVLALGDLRSIYLEQAATLLTRMINDRRQSVTDRSRLAGALAELGPEYVAQATGHLLAILDKPFLEPNERAIAAEELAKAHPSHHEKAAEHLRQVLADRGLDVNAKSWAAKALADLGAEYHEEASRGLLLLSTAPLAMGFFRVEAAGKLASLGPRYRDKAVAVLRQKLTGHAVDSDERVSAASELIGIGTEFHDEAAAALRTIATDPAEEEGNRVAAAAAFVGVHTSFHDQAVQIVQAVLRNRVASTSVRMRAARQLTRLQPTFREEGAATLRTLLLDTTAEWVPRTNAARFLADLGPEYTDEAAAGLRAMLDRLPPNSSSYRQVVVGLAGFGAEFRADAATALRAIMAAPTAPERRRAAALALAELGQEYWDSAESGLCAMLSDPDTPADVRREAADLLIRHGSRHSALATSALRAVLADREAIVRIRGHAAKVLARLGGQQLADAIDGLMGVLAEQVTPVRTRAQLAGVLAELGRGHREQARTSLRAMLAETGTWPGDRLEAVWQLMIIDAEYRDDRMAYFSAVLTDPTAPARDRCTAATRLVWLDQSATQAVIPVLKAMLTSPLTKPYDRLLVVNQLERLGVLNRAERIASVLAVALDPTASGSARGNAATKLRGHLYVEPVTSLEIERDLLHDHFVPVRDRIITWSGVRQADAPLREEKIAALREVLAEPEFDANNRLAAHVLLTEFGTDFKEAAADALRAVAADAGTSAATLGHALHALGSLGSRHRTQALTLAENIFSDLARLPRHRLEAATASVTLGGPGAAVLLVAIRDTQVSHRDRTHAATTLAWLGSGDAVTQLLESARDPASAPHTRQSAAATVAKVRPAEGPAMADILDELAGAATTRPAARWRIAATLAELGEPYGQRAVAHLQKIRVDTGLPASARIEAANSLASIQPTHLTAVADTLRSIAYAPTTTAAKRLHALTKLGSFTRSHCDEAVAALRSDMSDHSKSPTVRWRAAHAMVRLRRDTTIETALAVHQIIRSTDTPTHVKHRAARALARWSPPHRDEARHILAFHKAGPTRRTPERPSNQETSSD